jgi:hypothetical protein
MDIFIPVKRTAAKVSFILQPIELFSYGVVYPTAYVTTVTMVSHDTKEHKGSRKAQTSAAYVGFEVLTAVSMNIAVFWVVAPCSLVEVYQHFRGPCCLHHQGKLLP